MKKTYKLLFTIVCIIALSLIAEAQGQKANDQLSNLTTPTAINADLLPDADGLRNLGSPAFRWNFLHLKNLKYTDGNQALGKILTSDANGVASWNSFTTGSSGTDFSINFSGGTHTFNLPNASSINRGLLTPTDWSNFNGKQAALSGTGFMSYLARDPQARSISFWNLGTFSGASWLQCGIVSSIAIIGFAISFKDAKKLNAFFLGEDEAMYLGIDAKRLKRKIMIINTAMVAVATSFVGVIGFMGLIVPHVMRLVVGSDHRKLLPASMLAGALLLTIADMGARLLLAPAEIPIGIITSLVGAPIYIFLLKTNNLLQKEGGFNG